MAYTETKLTNLGHLKDLAIKAQAEIAAVEAKIPTNVSQLTNDAQYQTSSQVTTAIQQAIAASGHASFQKVGAVPEAESAQTNILYLVMNDETSHYDIYAKVDNEMVLLDDTTVDLSNYVQKDGDKVCRTTTTPTPRRASWPASQKAQTTTSTPRTPRSLRASTRSPWTTRATLPP